MGRLIAIPILGWFLAPLLAACMAIPFYVLWHGFGMADFFPFLPPSIHDIGFWSTVGLFLTISIMKTVCLPHMAVTQKVKSRD